MVKVSAVVAVAGRLGDGGAGDGTGRRTRVEVGDGGDAGAGVDVGAHVLRVEARTTLEGCGIGHDFSRNNRDPKISRIILSQKVYLVKSRHYPLYRVLYLYPF